jgi:hypothetical protein
MNGRSSRSLLLVDGLSALAFWIIAAHKDTTVAYVFAGLRTLRPLTDVARLWARAAGAPEWRADEAYITRWRRWSSSRGA